MNHLGGLLQAVSRLAHADVQHQLGDADLPHGVGCLLLVHCERDMDERSRQTPIEPKGCAGGHAPIVKGAPLSYRGKERQTGLANNKARKCGMKENRSTAQAVLFPWRLPSGLIQDGSR